MKSLTSLVVSVLHEAGTHCALSTSHDEKTIVSRVEHEGESFVTITLPTFAKSFERCLELGRIDPSVFAPTWRFRRGVPVFLRGFLGLVFDEAGCLLDNCSTDAIRSIRQICLVVAKVEGVCSDDRITEAFLQYIETDHHVGQGDIPRGDHRRVEFVSLARRIWGPLLSRLDSRVANGEILPRHGSGSTAERIMGNAKYTSLMSAWTDRLEQLFPWLEYAAASPRYQWDDDLTWQPEASELPVRVIAVPKTTTTPRIIAMEPVCMQYVQQGLHEAFYEELRAEPLLASLADNQSQLPNQQLARSASRDQTLATLDLSEASDRVSCGIVEDVIGSGLFSQAAFASRSKRATVLGEVINLNKFASMGSALTFPLETMVFLTVVLVELWRVQPTLSRNQLLKLAQGKVRVYGDDIICPVDIAPSVISSLESRGLKVNTFKSFLHGKFRESCGGDYYDGQPVKVVRCRQRIPESRRDVSFIISWFSLMNQLNQAGFVNTAIEIREHLTSLLGYVPDVHPDTGCMGWEDPLSMPQRTCSKLHLGQTKAWVVEAPLPHDPLEGHAALMKFWLKRGESPSEPGHLNFAGRPKTVRLKLRWVYQ